MKIGGSVELAVCKIGQLISHLRTSSRNGFACEKETVIWRRQFVYVLYKLQFRNGHIMSGSMILGQLSSKSLCVFLHAIVR